MTIISLTTVFPPFGGNQGPLGPTTFASTATDETLSTISSTSEDE